jgi:hypothetical protein
VTGAMQLFDPEPFSMRCWPCPRCGGMPTPMPGLEHLPEFGADPCLGWLTDVAHACCGHGFSRERDPWDRTGDSRRPYVVISPGYRPHTAPREIPDHVLLEGEDALAYFRSRGVGPP